MFRKDGVSRELCRMLANSMINFMILWARGVFQCLSHSVEAQRRKEREIKENTPTRSSLNRYKS